MSFELSPEVDGSQVFLVPSSEIDTRLDPFYYRTEFQLLEKRLHNSPYRVEKLIRLLKKLVNGYDCRDYAEEGIPYLKVANVKPNEIVLEGVSYIPDLPIDKDATVRQGDFLLTRKGSFGIAAVVSDEVDRAIISSEVFKLTLRDTLDGRYLAYWFNTTIGQLYFDRIKTGAIMGHISQEALKGVLVPVPPLEIQNRIVEKMDAAYTVKKQKEAEAQQLLDSVDDYLLTELGIEKPAEQDNTLKNRIYYRKLSELTGGRFDPFVYLSERLSSVRAVEKSVYPVSYLREVVTMKKNIVTELRAEMTYIGLENVQSKSGEYVETSEKESVSSALSFSVGDILFPKLRPYLNKVFHAPFAGVCSTEFHVFDGLNVNNSYITGFLRSEVVVSQTKHLMTGNTLPRLQIEDIRSLLIPVPPIEKQNEIAEHIASIRQQAKRLQQEASEGLEQAKCEVEAMILGEEA